MKIFEFFPFISFLVFAFAILGRVIFLKKRGIQVSSKKSTDNKRDKFLYPIFVLIFILWLFEIVRSITRHSFSLLPELITEPISNLLWIRTIGILIIMLALVVLVLALLHFKNSLRFGLDVNNLGEMVTSGIFSISRNPFFLSINFYFIGIALIMPSPFIIAFSIVAIISIHLFILKEEKFLRKNYGTEYKAYMKKVRRYF